MHPVESLMLRTRIPVLFVLIGFVGNLTADEPKVAKAVKGEFKKLEDGKVTFTPSGATEPKTYAIDKNAKSFIDGKAVPIGDVMKEWKEGQAATFYISGDEVVGVLVTPLKK